MSLPARDEIDPQYRWDLTSIFESPDAREEAYKSLEADLDAFDAAYDATGEARDPPLESTDELATFVDELSDLSVRRQSVKRYAKLVQDVTDEPTADDRMRHVRELERRFESVVAVALQALSRTDDELLDSLIADLDDRRHYVEGLRLQARHRRTPEVEDVVGAFEEARSAPDRTILTVTTEDLDPPELERPDGETVAVTYGRYRGEVSNPDRAYRQRVYEAFHEELGRFERTLATTYAEKLQAASTLADVRGFDSLREAQFTGRSYPESGLVFSLDPAVHDSALESLRENLGPRNRARRLRADRLGVETLRPWDRDAPVVDAPEPTISFDEARALIVDAMAPLGDSYQDRLRQFFAERRVDAVEHEGRRNDVAGYCLSTAHDGAFVLLNFQEDLRTTFFLCHELGHAMNVAHHREGPDRYATCPRPIEEVPSFVHELLLVEECRNRGGALAAHAENRLVRAVEGNLYGAAAWSAFVHRLATAVDDGDSLDAERIADAHVETIDAWDPLVERPDDDRTGWLELSMAREPYHHYQYVLGMAGALAVRDALADGTLTPESYRRFLRETGRRSAVDSFERLGLDVTKPAPFERAAGHLDASLDAIE